MWSLGWYSGHMTSVGIRELKAHLSDYIRRAEKGESITVTDRGRAVARLGPEPIQKPTSEERMKQLVAEGLLEWSGEPLPDIEPILSVSRGFSLADLVVREREAHMEQLMENVFGTGKRLDD